jgi:hypothetical protein
MSENQTEDKISKPEPRWWKPYWIILVIATIVIGITLPFRQGISWEQAIILLAFFLVVEGIAYYARVKVSIRLNRVMYILLGAPIGFVLWLVAATFLSRIYTQGFSEDIAIIVSLAVCFGIGALIGDLIGRARHYKGPEQYQP